MRRRIFVSSVQKELDVGRRGVKSMIENDSLLSAHFEVVLYELLPPHGQRVDSDPLDVLDTCQIYLLIVGKEYGSVVRDGYSMTHLEYRRAKENEARHATRVLVYIQGERDWDREESTNRLLAEVERDKFKYKRFKDVVELQDAVRSSLARLVRPLPRIDLPDVLRWLLLLVLILSAILPVVIPRWKFARVQQTQRQVQSVEETLNRLHRVRIRPDGAEVYTDVHGAWLAQDIWRDGRLERRRLFRDGRLAAEDRFEYSGGIVTGKKRYYVDAANRIFLVDTFAVDGALTGKDGYPDGLQGKPVNYLDVMRSPLPPVPPFVSYR